MRLIHVKFFCLKEMPRRISFLILSDIFLGGYIHIEYICTYIYVHSESRKATDDLAMQCDFGSECIFAVFPWYFVFIPRNCLLRNVYKHPPMVAYVNFVAYVQLRSWWTLPLTTVKLGMPATRHLYAWETIPVAKLFPWLVN